MKPERLSRHNVLLFPGDYDKMKDLYPGFATRIVRALVRKHLAEVEKVPELRIDMTEESE